MRPESVIMNAALGPRFARWPTRRMAYAYLEAGKYANYSGYITGHKGFTGAAIAAVKGDPVFPIMSGKVTKTNHDKELGNYVVILHPGGISSYYCHLNQIDCSVGQLFDCVDGNWVKALGKAGDTGSAHGGAHLHLILLDSSGQELNPIEYLPPPK